MKLIIQSEVKPLETIEAVLKQINEALAIKDSFEVFCSHTSNIIVHTGNTIEECTTFVQATITSDITDFPGEGMEAMTLYEDRISQRIGTLLRRLCAVRGNLSIEFQDIDH